MILLFLALIFLILMQQRVMMTKRVTMKMLTRIGMMTWAGLAEIITHSIKIAKQAGLSRATLEFSSESSPY